jgi:hypothetical protein
MAKLLLDEAPLVILPTLVVKIGLNEAILLQQFHYWIEINRKSGKNLVQDKTWTYGSCEQWQSENFPFWSTATVRRTINGLVEKGLLLKGNFNPSTYDRTLWYTIDYEALESVVAEKPESLPFDENDKCIYSNCTNGSAQIEQMDLCKLSNSLKEIKTETKKEILQKTKTSTLEEKASTETEMRKRGDLVDGMLAARESLDFRVKRAIETTCRITPSWRTQAGREFIAWACSQGEEFFARLEKFVLWWRTVDFRGKQGQPVTLYWMRELWPQAEIVHQAGSQFETFSVINS